MYEAFHLRGGKMKQELRKKDLVRTIVLVVATVIIAGGCSMPFEWAGSMPDSWDDTSEVTPEEDGDAEGESPVDPEAVAQVLTVSGPSFTLAWDSDSAAATGFRVYLRQHGASEWQVIAENVGEAQFTISESDLPYGTYEFAVSSLTSEGAESELHHSYDETADPEPWILEWTAL